MHLKLIKVTKDLRQDNYKQFLPPESVYRGVYRAGGKAVGYNGDLGGWIKHFKAKGVKTYLKYGGEDWNPVCALYREILETDKEWLENYPIYAVKVLATELVNPEGYVYPVKGGG